MQLARKRAWKVYFFCTFESLKWGNSKIVAPRFVKAFFLLGKLRIFFFSVLCLPSVYWIRINEIWFCKSTVWGSMRVSFCLSHSEFVRSFHVPIFLILDSAHYMFAKNVRTMFMVLHFRFHLNFFYDLVHFVLIFLSDTVPLLWRNSVFNRRFFLRVQLLYLHENFNLTANFGWRHFCS